MSFQQLDRQRSDIEKEIKNQEQVLLSNKVDMHTPLVDSEGFPRADIDIYAIRSARKRIIELNNDYKDLMKLIEKELQSQFQQGNTTTNLEKKDHQPFARVDSVVPGSPADIGGLQVGDFVIQFATVRDPLKWKSELAIAIQENKNKNIIATIKRANEQKSLVITPKEWNGPGLLGCHMVPV